MTAGQTPVGAVVSDESGRTLRVTGHRLPNDSYFHGPLVETVHLDPDCVNPGGHRPRLLPTAVVHAVRQEAA